MSKGQTKAPVVDLSRCCKSTFTLTFAIEVLDIDVWHDCNEGWIDLGPYFQGMKIQYQLYPGQTFELNIMIWPHVAKIWCGNEYGWVRTWQFLERRFFTFSISHAFPVRVVDLGNFTATITPTIGIGNLGANAKNDKNVEVFIPPLQFGERRYFAPVVEGEKSLSLFRLMEELIWARVKEFIPASYLDGTFNVPGEVTDIRHQDTILYHVKEAILNTKIKEQPAEPEPQEQKIKPESKATKEKEKDKKKPADASKIKFEFKLSGHAILAGVGRIVPFESIGERPVELGEILVLISSNNLPAQDDLPIIFVNIDTLTDPPLEYMNKQGITELYTRWIIGDETHISQPQKISLNKNDIKFNDHYAMPIDPGKATKITAMFLDDPFQIELRGIRIPSTQKDPKFFGYQKGDHNFGASKKKFVKEDIDILLAVTKIDGRNFSKGVNMVVRGEYPLYPPKVEVAGLDREEFCTNDINRIQKPMLQNFVVPTHVILQAQMTLEVSVGFVGCKPKILSESYARLFCFVRETESVMLLLKQITEINDIVVQSEEKDHALTGFAVDVGNTVIVFVEGKNTGEILHVWEMTANFFPKVKPIFSTSARYATRIYPELLLAPVPFTVMKMHVPLGVILVCPAIYARPALPYPTRAALLKFGRLVSNKIRGPPCRCDMPTATELKSFRLELCVAPKPAVVDGSNFGHGAQDENEKTPATENGNIKKAIKYNESVSFDAEKLRRAT